MRQVDRFKLFIRARTGWLGSIPDRGLLAAPLRETPPVTIATLDSGARRRH
jgi:hypothetical protein